MTDFNVSITASNTGSGYQYRVSDTSASGVESGWWYYVVVQFPGTDKVSNDQKDGAEHDPIDGNINIKSSRCGHTSSRNKPHKKITVILYRSKHANKFTQAKENYVMEKEIDVKIVS